MLILGVMFLIHAQAQERTVTGRVTDQQGNPVPLASVTVRGTTIGTTTSNTGEFTITVPANAEALIISSIGMTQQEIALTTSETYTVSLAPSAGDLQEVVVVGYGPQKRRDLTGSVATVQPKDIENKPFSSIDKALQGQVAGLQSVSASGQPGSSQAILIRGVSSITAGNAPL